MLTRYAVERLLHRLSRSPYRDRYVLKGAMLFSVWGGEPHRATRDLDLMGRGENSVAAIERIFRRVCKTAVEEDGIEFLSDSIQGETIQAGEEYEGVRLSLIARLAGARIPVQVDVGFGEAIVPEPDGIAYPTLLGSPEVPLLAYPREVVVAEKFQAMVMLGFTNSRMKDFYDVWFLSQRFEFEGERLCRALSATFRQRQTNLPSEIPMALSPEFHDDEGKQVQWRAFLRKGRLGSGEASLPSVAGGLRSFLLPPAASINQKAAFDLVWPAGGPWRGRRVRRRSPRRSHDL